MPLRYNGELFSVVSGAAIEAADQTQHEIEGIQSAEYRLTETDQVDPAGRWRTRLESDTWKLQRADTAGSHGITADALRVTWKTYISASTDGVVMEPLSTDQSALMQEFLRYLQDIRMMLELAFEHGT